MGLRDAALLEKLQLDSELTLDKAVTRVWQTEAIKQQQSLLRGEEGTKPDLPVGAVQKEKHKPSVPRSGRQGYKPRQRSGSRAAMHS